MVSLAQKKQTRVYKHCDKVLSHLRPIYILVTALLQTCDTHVIFLNGEPLLKRILTFPTHNYSACCLVCIWQW